jgi:hypothetical protein
MHLIVTITGWLEAVVERERHEMNRNDRSMRMKSRPIMRSINA